MSDLPAGLPPPPRSLRALVHAGSEHWREMERIHAHRMNIQQDLYHGQSNANHTTEQHNGHTADHHSSTTASSVGASSGPQGLQGAILHLRKEMVFLRQLDSSLLCQFLRINEAIKEIKANTEDAANLDEHDETDEADYLEPSEDGEYMEPVPVRPPRKIKQQRSHQNGHSNGHGNQGGESSHFTVTSNHGYQDYDNHF